jgi:hypothetical protein
MTQRRRPEFAKVAPKTQRSSHSDKRLLKSSIRSIRGQSTWRSFENSLKYKKTPVLQQDLQNLRYRLQQSYNDSAALLGF